MKFQPLKKFVAQAQAQSHSVGTGAGQRLYLRWLILAAVFLMTVILTSPFYLYLPEVYEEGEQVAETRVSAWTDYEVTLPSALAQWRKQRERRHNRVWEYQTGAEQQVRNDVSRIIETTLQLNPKEEDPEEMLQVLERLDRRLPLSKETINEFVSSLREPFFRQAMDSIINNAYSNYLIADDFVLLKNHLQSDVAIFEGETAGIPYQNRRDNVLPAVFTDSNWKDWEERIVRPALVDAMITPRLDAMHPRAVRMLLTAAVQPNAVFNEEKTQAARANFPIGNLSVSYSAGDLLLNADEPQVITADQEELLSAHRQAVSRAHNQRLLGHVFFILIVFSLISFYIQKFSRDFSFNVYYVTLLPLPVLLALAFSFVTVLLADGRTDITGYLFPSGVIGMMGVLLLDVRMALLLVTWGCLLMGLQADLNWEFSVIALFGGYTAVASTYTIRKRYEVFIASVLVGLVNAAVILLLGYIKDTEFPFSSAALGLFAGIGTFLVLAILPIVERFGIVTDMQLLELTGLQNAMLRRLEELAPGSWQHTLNVSKLAEAAALQVGVNYLLIRAGCYYHDIGKTKKPQYFTENQITKEEKMLHQDLKPIMSTFVIKNHVKEGVEMARKEGLPERIIEFIEQHHGTSVITYFYHKALEVQARGDDKSPVRIEDYRYPGPKPQSIEAAIVMLADSVEATATAKLSGRTIREEEIKQIVRTTILDKFNDGQFDECNLTLRDLNSIREVFVSVLKSRFHTRIDYPSAPGTAKKKKRKEEKPETRMDKSEEQIKREKAEAAS